MPKIYDEDEQQRAVEHYYETHKPGSWMEAFRVVMNRPAAQHTDTDVERFRKRRLQKKRADPGFFDQDAVPKSFSARIAQTLAGRERRYEEAASALPAAERELARSLGLDYVPDDLEPILSRLEGRIGALDEFLGGPPDWQDEMILRQGIRDLEDAESFYREQAKELRLAWRQLDKVREVARLRSGAKFPAGK